MKKKPFAILMQGPRGAWHQTLLFDTHAEASERARSINHDMTEHPERYKRGWGPAVVFDRRPN